MKESEIEALGVSVMNIARLRLLLELILNAYRKCLSRRASPDRLNGAIRAVTCVEERSLNEMEQREVRKLQRLRIVIGSVTTELEDVCNWELLETAAVNRAPNPCFLRNFITTKKIPK